MAAQQPPFAVGERVRSDASVATVRYVGSVASAKDQKAIYIGVVWDDPTRGEPGAEGRPLTTVPIMAPPAPSRRPLLARRPLPANHHLPPFYSTTPPHHHPHPTATPPPRHPPGKHDGSAIGSDGVRVRHFSCAEGAGSFLKPKKIQRGETFASVLRRR